MSGKFVRASSYRHVHGEPAKIESCFQDIRPAAIGDGNYISANDKYFAMPSVGGGGPILVHSIKAPGRLGHAVPMVNVHKAAVLDCQFNPFNSNILASAAEDLLTCITVIPEGGVKENITTAAATLEGHQKKVTEVKFHPTAANVLATASADFTVKTWDIESSTNKSTFEHGEALMSIDWNTDGSLLASAAKDHKLRIFDPRDAKSVVSCDGHGGVKKATVVWMDNHSKIASIGFSKTASRQIAVFDMKKMDKPITEVDIDQSAGVFIPFYDPDNSILYLTGKGDSSIKYFEIVDDDPFCHFLSEFRDTKSQKGCGWVSKRACDTKKCEIAVALRVMRDLVQPISFQVPRKSDLFQKDIFPDTYAGVSAMTATEYYAGTNKPPVLQSMKPGDAAASSSVAATTFAPTKSVAQLQAELDAALKKIAELEAKLATSL